jgi:hypothetical protein
MDHYKRPQPRFDDNSYPINASSYWEFYKLKIISKGSTLIKTYTLIYRFLASTRNIYYKYTTACTIKYIYDTSLVSTFVEIIRNDKNAAAWYLFNSFNKPDTPPPPQLTKIDPYQSPPKVKTVFWSNAVSRNGVNVWSYLTLSVDIDIGYRFPHQFSTHSHTRKLGYSY